MLKMKLSDIPDGAFIFVSQDHFMAKLIKFYEVMEDFKDWIKNPKQFMPHHVQWYVGITSKGKNICWSAESSGFKQMKIQKRFTKDSTVVMAQYLPLTVQQFECMKAYCKGASGKMYDFAGIAQFAAHFLGWIPFIRKLVHLKISDWDFALYCSEAEVEIGEAAKIKMSIFPADETTPAHSFRYICDDKYVDQDEIIIGNWRFVKVWVPEVK